MTNEVIKDQEYFFNEYSKKAHGKLIKDIPYVYSNKEQVYGFEFLKDCHNLLDYGCGVGYSIDLFFDGNLNPSEYIFTGVDIAEKALEKIKEKYPYYSFFKVEGNDLSFIEDLHFDGAYMIHVLHHSTDHQKMFNQISKKLKTGGKFFLSDLSSANLFIRFGRWLYPIIGKFISTKFEDDLVIDSSIPDKYVISRDKVVEMLKAENFDIVEVGNGHLFFFLLCWVNRFIPFMHVKVIEKPLNLLMKLEEKMTRMTFFKDYCEVFYILAVKSDVKP